MKSTFRKEVKSALHNLKVNPDDILTEIDIQKLPIQVQKYLKFVGVIGKPKVKSVMVKATGQIKSNPLDLHYMNFASEQYNAFDKPFRAFYIKAKKMGVPAIGLHLYKEVTAVMIIKIAGLFKIADARGNEMDKGETVTVFNDMCFMAPASLVDSNIEWEVMDQFRVKAFFTNGSVKISAVLTFDEEGKLIDFISNDRYETADGKVYRNYPWRTPVKEYGFFNGFHLPAKAEAIWVKPEGEFCYGIFNLNQILYNVDK
jgi:hypothetical protein